MPLLVCYSSKAYSVASCSSDGEAPVSLSEGQGGAGHRSQLGYRSRHCCSLRSPELQALTGRPEPLSAGGHQRQVPGGRGRQSGQHPGHQV